MGYNSGPSGKTDNPILRSKRDKRKRRLASRPQYWVTADVQSICQRLDTKEEESRGKRKGTFGVQPNMDSVAFPPQKTYNFFRVFTLFLLFFVTSEPALLARETTGCHQTGGRIMHVAYKSEHEERGT